jgi:hypothetical protein
LEKQDTIFVPGNNLHFSFENLNSKNSFFKINYLVEFFSVFFQLDWSDLGHQLSSEISPNAPFSRVQKNLESPLLLQILPETSSIWAFLALLYRGEVAVAVLHS